MSAALCPRETEVVQAVIGGPWPEACGEGLRRHVEGCESCREVAAMVTLFSADYDRARRDLSRRDGPLPSAGQIWWRAAVRARADAVRASARPLVWAYGVAAACAAGLVAAVTGLAWPAVEQAAARLEWLVWRAEPGAGRAADAVLAAVQGRLPLVVAVAACVVLAPVAVYLAVRHGENG